MSRHMERIVRDAVAQGLLTDAEQDQADQQRHWSVLVLTAVASWFSAVPLLIVVFLILSPALKEALGSLIVGGLLLVVAVVLLRSKTSGMFVEQLGVPCLIPAGVLLGLGIFEVAGTLNITCMLLIPVACIVAWVVPRAWLRSLLGGAIAGLAAFSVPGMWEFNAASGLGQWLGWHMAGLVWLGLQAIQRTVKLSRESAPLLALAEALSDGMAAATLIGLAVFSGSTFLLGSISGAGHYSSSSGAGAAYPLVQLVSSALACSGAAWLARRWPALRAWWYAPVAGLLAVAAWFVPSLGAVLLVMAVCGGSGRYALAALAGACALWMVGGLYYQLAWPLATKAMLLAGIGAAMGALARFAVPAEIEVPAEPVPQPAAVAEPTRRIGLLLCGVVVLAVANVAIWQKESLIRVGAPVFVELAPVDPRSLMQGDFMQLRFAIPLRQTDQQRPGRLDPAPRVIARTDARGVATLLRLDDGAPLAPGEFSIQLVAKNGNWTIATDAWFFKEGEGARWAGARYGEFRIDAGGRALLVGLRGADLRTL